MSKIKDRYAKVPVSDLFDRKYDWSFWAREKQIAPDWNWFIWLILAGRGFGKTRTGAEWVRSQMCGDTPLTGGKIRHMALVAETYADARKVMVGDGLSDFGATRGILQVHPNDFRPTYNSSLKRLTWPNGAIATHYNATEPDELRGPQHDAAWCDELAKWFYVQDTWDQLMFGLRMGIFPRVCVTTTPRPIPLVRALMNDKTSAITRGSMYENKANLPDSFLSGIRSRYEGTRLGRQEIAAEILDDMPGALWTRAMIEECRVRQEQVPPMKRVVVGVDPSGSSGSEGEKNNQIGIVAAGLGEDDKVYVLTDNTCSLSPAGWGKKAIETLTMHDGDRIVAEKNFGGAMVEHVIRTAWKEAPIKMVTASRGKVARAEPVSALYEQHKVKHVGSFPALEDQMCTMGPDGYGDEGSPDRVDALVWAITDLKLEKPWQTPKIPQFAGLPIARPA